MWNHRANEKANAMKCPTCQNDMIGLNGPPVCPSCARKRNAEERLARTACSPLRVAYSRAELADKLKDWMIELWGDSPKNLDPEQRDQWHRDNGLIYHFICDHFPAENADVDAQIPAPSKPESITD